MGGFKNFCSVIVKSSRSSSRFTSDVALLLRELLYSIMEDLVVREVVVKAEFILGSDYSNYMTLEYIIYHGIKK